MNKNKGVGGFVKGRDNACVQISGATNRKSVVGLVTGVLYKRSEVPFSQRNRMS
jgi:hypothetical protein